MDKDQIYLTIVHISDLHFYHEVAGRGIHSDPKLPTLLALSKHFDGWLGHHYKGSVGS